MQNNILRKITQKFDWQSLNVSPFLVNRSLKTYSSWVLIFVLPKNHQKYQALRERINFLLSDFTEGIGFNLDLEKEFKLRYDKKTKTGLQENSYYTIDFRNEPDNEIKSLVEIQNLENIVDWELNEISEQILKNCRGLVIFADKIDQIPAHLLTQSQIGLSSDHENFSDFITRAGGVNNCYDVEFDEKTRLHGYIKMIKWTRFVQF